MQYLFDYHAHEGRGQPNIQRTPMDGTREQFHSEFKTDLDLERLYPKGARRIRKAAETPTTPQPSGKPVLSLVEGFATDDLVLSISIGPQRVAPDRTIGCQMMHRFGTRPNAGA